MSLSSEQIDIAIVCTSKAKEFVLADDRFILVPDVILNSSVVVIGDIGNKSVGISSGREYEKCMVNDLLGDKYEVVYSTTKALPYLLEKDEVGAVVIDYLSSVHLNGTKIFPDKSKSYSTYSMIISKKFMQSDEYNKFVDEYNDVIKYLSVDYNFLDYAKKLYNENYTEGRIKEEWQLLGLEMQTLKK